MNSLTSEQNIRLILGLKVKQLRQGKGMSFKDLSEASGMSVSYLNEIEKGKKYPKTEKIVMLSRALEVRYDDLVSLKLDKKWQPILDLLNSGFLENLPLHLFGLEVNTLMEIISTAPAKVNAFISTIVKVARNYEMSREHFFFAALRSYQEMHDNYFEELEEAVDRLVAKFQLDVEPPVHRTQLYDVLRDSYGYTIDKQSLTEHEELKPYRAVFLPKKRHLLINDTLTDTQKSFLLGKELAYNFLGMKERPNTSAPFPARSFDEVLNNFKASYFSVALFMNRHLMLKDLDSFFARESWDSEAFMALMRKYAASPEMFLSRLINLLTHYYGISNLFFLRFNHPIGSQRFHITKELHLSQLHNPHRNDLNEHYCRRWVSIQTLQALPEQAHDTDYHIKAQISSYLGSQNEYFCLSIARPNRPTPNTHVSVTLGILVDTQSRKKLRFLNDPTIPFQRVNETCERCPLAHCEERVAPPHIVERERRMEAVGYKLKALDEE
jgi:transcriptional regulator with XRE-family HTH domain